MKNQEIHKHFKNANVLIKDDRELQRCFRRIYKMGKLRIKMKKWILYYCAIEIHPN